MSNFEIVKDQDQGPGEFVKVIPRNGEVFSTDEVLVKIKNQHSGKYLSVDGSWHAEESEFGPYEVEPDGHIIVGPEICHNIDSFLTIELTAGNLSQELRWSPKDTLPVDEDSDNKTKNLGKDEDVELKSQISYLEDQNESLTAEIERLNNELEKKSESTENLEVNDEKLNEEVQHYKAEIARLKEEKEKLENKVKLLTEVSARKSSKYSAVIIIFFFLAQVIAFVAFCSPELLEF